MLTQSYDVSSASIEESGPVQRLRTAVVDDSRDFLEVVCALLEREDDLDVIARGSDGTDAVEIAAKLHPDLVLMDIDMPHLDGLNAGLIITTHFPWARVVLMSVEDSKELRADCMACGAVAFVNKARFRQEFSSCLRQLQDIVPNPESSQH